MVRRSCRRQSNEKPLHNHITFSFDRHPAYSVPVYCRENDARRPTRARRQGLTAANKSTYRSLHIMERFHPTQSALEMSGRTSIASPRKDAAPCQYYLQSPSLEIIRYFKLIRAFCARETPASRVFRSFFLHCDKLTEPD